MLLGIIGLILMFSGFVLSLIILFYPNKIENKKLRVVTIIAVFLSLFYFIYTIGLYNKHREAVEGCNDINYTYYKCIDKALKNDNFDAYVNCVNNHVELMYKLFE